MEFKIIYLISIIFAFTAGSPTVTEISNASIDTVESPTITYSNDADNLRADEPAAIFIGKNNGEMLRCLHNNPDTCIVFNQAGSAINSIVVSGEYIYAALRSGTMWRCDLYNKNSCWDFNTAGSSINALAVSGGNIYAGLNSGIIWRCKLTNAHSCYTFHDTGNTVKSLAASAEHIFAGLDNGKMLRCSIGTGDCFVLNTAGSSITALAVSGNTVFAGTSSGTMWSCSAKNTNSCTDLNKGGSAIISLSIFNSKIYAVLSSGTLWSCEMEKSNTCWEFKHVSGAMSISNMYSYVPMKSKYRDEHIKCSWQSEDRCPPYVVYYNIESRHMLKVRVVNGKLYNMKGILLDTSHADESHSGVAAIFVMDPSGQIFISNTHILYLIHHSSLMAGNPVAAAGEIRINQGVITDITTCSGHYHPSVTMNEQLVQSLYLQGYTNKFDVKNCLAKINY